MFSYLFLNGSYSRHKISSPISVNLFSYQFILTIYAPVNLTAPCIMIFMGASPL